ncbi:MAG: HD domain-containing phosphohydrolase [Vicinamibacterales bacterium]
MRLSAVRPAAVEGPPAAVPVMDVIAGLSRALDITEGHPQGHAARSAVIGMQCAELLKLSDRDRSDLFHALLLKDAGCSSNAARVHQLFGGDDHRAKRAVWLTDWRRWSDKIRYGLTWAGRSDGPLRRVARVAALAAAGPRAETELFRIRCDRGAAIALDLGLSTATAEAIRAMDEHWDGGGQPYGRRGDEIPLLAQIIGLSQVIEIFWQEHGRQAALDVVRDRTGRWFSPALAQVADAIAHDAMFWRDLATVEPVELLHRVAPAPALVEADDARLDRIVDAFAGVIDAKSPYTHDHSRRVAGYAVAAAARLGAADRSLVRLRRAALLHDIGKLGVPNSVLDKPGRLTDEEWPLMRSHTQYTHQILEAVPLFRDVAFDAACHHERLDGSGYHLGLGGAALGPAARLLAVADVTDALRSDRPYRPGLDIDAVVAELHRDVERNKLCPRSVEAMCDVLGTVVDAPLAAAS